MIKREKLVPNRRFKEFECNSQWKQSSMKDVVDVYDGTHQTPRYTDSGIMFLSVENIQSLISNKYISHEHFKRDFKIYPEAGDVLMSRIGDIGTANVVESNEEKAYYVTLALLKKKKLDPYFLKENIHSPFVKRELSHRTLHIAFPKKINMNEIGKVLISYPCNLEQQKIGKFFKVLDERIANQERKIAKVKALKTAYLTEMFPQEGDTVPKRRFKGFEGEWIKRKVGEIFQVTRGNVLSTTKVEKKQSKISCYPVYSSQTQDNGLLGYYSDYLFDTAITWTTDGANAGTVNYREGKFYSTNVNGVLISQEGYACKAVAEILDLEAWKHVSKVGNPKLMNNVMSNIEILISNNIKELEMLSLFFKNLDDQIATEEKKLEKLKKMKEAYLEEMFV